MSSYENRNQRKMYIKLPNRTSILCLACMMLLAEPVTGSTFEMDCGYAHYRLSNPWFVEPTLTILYEFSLDYNDFGCQALTLGDDILVCQNRYEFFYRVDRSRTIRSKDHKFVTFGQNAKEEVIPGHDYYVIEALTDGKWQELPLYRESYSSTDESFSKAYLDSARFPLMENWSSVHDYTRSFNFKLGRIKIETVHEIIQDNPVVDREVKGNNDGCEFVE